MGWGYGVLIDGTEVGYTVDDVCHHPECGTEIDRGLSHVCGNMPGDGLGCGGFFCADHLEPGPEAREDDDFPQQLCAACRKEWEGILGSAYAYCDSTFRRSDDDDDGPWTQSDDD